MSIGNVTGNRRPVVDCSGVPSKTKQSFRETCDINNIIKRYKRTGVVEHLNSKPAFYGDVSGIKTYQEALGVVANAEALFMGMSAKIREKFKNNPAEMIAFLSDEKNHAEAVELGMCEPKAPAAAPAAPAAAPAAPAAAPAAPAAAPAAPVA